LARFLVEADDTPIGVDFYYPKLLASSILTGNAATVTSAAFFLVLVDHLADVHPVDMVLRRRPPQAGVCVAQSSTISDKRVGGAWYQSLPMRIWAGTDVIKDLLRNQWFASPCPGAPAKTAL